MVNRDQEFGQKLPIKLPKNATRSFTADVTEVVFVDNEIWTCDNDDWESLPAAKPLESWLTDRELLKQYKMRYGQDCNYVPEKIRDLWHCTCGATNHSDEETCHICRKSRSTLLCVDINQLIAERDSRLRIEAEAEAARLKKKAEEEAARQKREAEEKAAAEAKAAENRRKAQNITIVVFASLTVIIGVILLLTKVIIPNNNYNKAQALLAEGKYEEAAATFDKIGDYKDSADMIEECQYRAAVELLDSGKYEQAISAFINLGNYKNSSDMVFESYYRKAIDLMNVEDYGEAIPILEKISKYKDSKDIVLEYKYNKAVSDMESGYFDDAISGFQELGDYKESLNNINQCIEIKNNNAYRAAEKLMENGEYDAAINAFKKLENYNNSDEMVSECMYRKAVELSGSGEYDKAIEVFEQIITYKDSANQIELCRALPFAAAEVGDILSFGIYNDSILTWRVLAREENSLLLITEHCVDKRHFQFNQNNPKYYIDSSIRKFLNETFYKTAFSADEQSLIETHYLPTTGGDVNDKVFLLSDTEANYYFNSNSDRKAGDHMGWFLRTVNPVVLAVLNYEKPIAMIVDGRGEIVQLDWTTDYERGVRPAIWLDVSSYVNLINQSY